MFVTEIASGAGKTPAGQGAGKDAKNGAAAGPAPTRALTRAARRAAALPPTNAERLPFLEALFDLMTSGLSAGEAVRLLSIRIKEPQQSLRHVHAAGGDGDKFFRKVFPDEFHHCF